MLSERRLPSDICFLVLEYLPPREIWALRSVSKIWKDYIEQVLVHTHLLPMLSIYLRSSESYAFYPTIDNGSGKSVPGQGVKFVYTASSDSEETAVFNLAHRTPQYRLELVDRIQFHVQVMVQFDGKWFRHIKIPSLAMDLRNLELSIDWREVLNVVLVMPELGRKRLERKLQPATWVWHAFGEGRWGREWIEWSTFRLMPNLEFQL